MADYNISAEITADASGFESGIKKAQKASKSLSSTVSGVVKGLGKSGLVGALGAVGLASAGVSAVLGTVAKVAKKVAQTVDECSQAYRKQYQAEIALSTAVNNNPYVDGTATKRLKEFASEMQRVSDIGDEELLPMMADLIAKGRTEDETMQIMSVALDMSAGGAMSLDTAITQLNATLNGNVGRLGQQNAELKDLTEEELKQGKAVEILGAKYKGLAQATADSQKQLKNAVGDLKENMGQIFEQALAPMRKFFTEVITNLNNSITKSRELKSSMKEVFGDNGDVNLGASTDALNTAFTEVLHKQQEVTKNYQQYIQLHGKYIDQATDETALSYKSQINDLNAQIKAISEELNKRRRESEEEKKRLAKEKADAEAKAELEKQKELREKQLVLENEWADKLFAIRLENLEATREKELENEKLTQEEREAIVDFYGEQILIMKIKQLEKERDEALKQENLTEDSRRSINLYYENKITNARKDEEEKRLKLKKKTSEEEVKDEKKKFAEMLRVAGEYTKKVAETFKNVAKKIASTVKSVISSVGNIFTKLVEFKPDEALDNLLKFEDAVLTFFVETLPNLPSFFESAFQSVAVLIQTIFNIIDFDNIANIIGTIENGLFDLITTVAKSINGNANRLTKGFVQIVKTIIEGLANWISSDGWKEFLDLLLLIQTSLEEAVAQNADLFAETLAKMLPDLVDMLIKSIVSASRTLGKIAKSLLPLVAKVINAVIEVITSNEVIEASIEAVGGLVEGLIPAIVEILVNALPRIINLFLLKLPSYTPQLIIGIINGIVNALSEMDFVVIVDAFFDGFADALSNFDTGSMTDGLSKLFQKLFSFDFWIDSFANITGALVELIKKAFTSINFSSFFTFGGSSGGSSGGGKGSTGERIVKGLLTGGLSEVFGWANGSNNVPKGLAIVGEAGPELVRFNGGEQVLNNRNTNKALANMGKANNTFNVTFNNLQDTTAFAMMSQLKAYNRQMAINGIM